MQNDYSYFKLRQKKMKPILRLYLGVQQLVFYPYYNIGIILMLSIFRKIWINKKLLLDYIYKITNIGYSLERITAIMLVFVFSMFILLYIRKVGNHIAEKVEGKLVSAFTVSDLKNGHPILMEKRKKNGIIIFKFLNSIPIKRWKEMKEEIEDFTNMHFVPPYIEYGGRNRNNSNFVTVYMAKNRKAKKRGTMYEEV